VAQVQLQKSASEGLVMFTPKAGCMHSLTALTQSSFHPPTAEQQSGFLAQTWDTQLFLLLSHPEVIGSPCVHSECGQRPMDSGHVKLLQIVLTS
jgi:hypothetical protein